MHGVTNLEQRWRAVQQHLRNKGNKYIELVGKIGVLGGLTYASTKQILHDVDTIVALGEQLDAHVVQFFLEKVHKMLMKRVNDDAREHVLHAYTQDNNELLTRLHRRKQERETLAHKRELQTNMSPSDVKDVFHTHLQPLAKTLPEDAKLYGKLLKRAIRRLQAHINHTTLTPRLHLFVHHIIAHLPDVYVLEFLKGGHAHFYDDGKLYSRVMTTEGSHMRISSHYPQFKKTPHLGLTIRVPTLPVFHLLTGVVRRHRREVVTWIQLESSPMPSFWRLFHDEGLTRNLAGLYGHVRDYIAHRRSHKQYGPLGTSLYSEKTDTVICIGAPSRSDTRTRKRSRSRSRSR